MNSIKAEISKEKASKKIIYSFEVNNDAFKAYYFPGKKSTLEISHNGSSLGTIDNPKAKSEYTVNSETKPVKITAWIDNKLSLASFLGKVKGIGIEVDGRPVQNTVSDPETHINIGRSGLYILLFFLIIKSAWTYYSSYKNYEYHIVSIISSSIYFIPFIYVLILTIKYKTWTTLAIISGVILTALEMIDYIIGIPASVTSTGSSFVVWIIIRLSALYVLCNAFIWRRKQLRNSQNLNNQL
ncbi:hypothetical protein R84B8_01899 [Treponema sp. R8-4-B8]